MLSHDVFCRLKKQHGCPWKGPLNKLQVLHIDYFCLLSQTMIYSVFYGGPEGSHIHIKNVAENEK